MFDNHFILAVMGSPMPALPLPLRPIEYATVAIAIGFLLYQLVYVWPDFRKRFGLVLFGAILWGALVCLTGFTLCHLWQSGLFLALVLLNIAIAFHKTFSHKAKVIFLDMTACFCICHLAPTTHWWDVAVDSGGHYAGVIPRFRDHYAIIMNMVSVAIIIGAYLLFKKLGILTSTHTEDKLNPHTQPTAAAAARRGQ